MAPALSRRRPPRPILVAMLLALGAAALAGGVWFHHARPGGRGIDPDDAVQVARGASLYLAHCAGCHGRMLEGETGPRRDAMRPAPPLDATGPAPGRHGDYLFAVTKHGLARFMPPDYKSAMPSFIGILGDDDLRAVIAFIESRWPVAMRPAGG